MGGVKTLSRVAASGLAPMSLARHLFRKSLHSALHLWGSFMPGIPWVVIKKRAWTKDEKRGQAVGPRSKAAEHSHRTIRTLRGGNSM